MTNFDDLWLKHAGDQDSTPLLNELDSLVQKHQLGFGPSPLKNECYRLSDDDAGKYPSAYVHYFGYLWQEYMFIFDPSLSLRLIPLTPKWKSFSILPQIAQRIPFVDLNARAISDLARISTSKRMRPHVLAALKSYRPKVEHLPCTEVQLKDAVTAKPFMDWLLCNNQGALDLLNAREKERKKKADAKRAEEEKKGGDWIERNAED